MFPDFLTINLSCKLPCSYPGSISNTTKCVNYSYTGNSLFVKLPTLLSEEIWTENCRRKRGACLEHRVASSPCAFSLSHLGWVRVSMLLPLTKVPASQLTFTKSWFYLKNSKELALPNLKGKKSQLHVVIFV